LARILFFTPVLPGITGQGTAIRAGVALEVLAEEHEVTLVHIDLWTGDRAIADPFWPRRIAACHFVPAPPPAEAAAQLVKQHLSAAAFDAVYVFRLVAAPFALSVVALLPQPPRISILDLDDDECARTERFLALRGGGDPARERSELQRLRGFARIMLTRFDIALLAAQFDLDAIAAQYPGRRFALLPNVMRVPEAQPARTPAPGALLFIGTLDYFPNEDAVFYFADSILPILLASRSGQRLSEIDLRVVGIKPPKSLDALAARPGLTLVGPVKDVAPEYARATIMVVPLRAGSGTRIKILEAFRFGLPVVSTSIGAAGLDLQHGVHLLIADTPEEFASACLRLLDDCCLAKSLAANAFAWLRATHSLDRARAVLHPLFESLS
jgi:glycosyltransferase involved in cell wall biosynthesis